MNQLIVKAAGSMARVMVGALFPLCSALAQPIVITYPLGSAVEIQNNAGAYSGVAGFNNYPNGYPDWKISQWGNQSDVLPSPGAASGWTISNDHVAIKYYPNWNGHQNVYEMAQSANVCNNERDIFLSPHGFATSNYRFTPTANLDQLGSLMIRAGTSVAYADTSQPCVPATTIQYVMALVLGSSSGQILNYQINLGRHPYINQITSAQYCPNFTDNVFCLDDDVRNAGGVFVTGGDAENYFEFLPRLQEVIRQGGTNDSGPGMDNNPSHWRITGMYYGQIIQGKAVATSRHYSPKLSVMPGGSFCSGATTTQFVCSAGQPDGPGWTNVGAGCYHRNAGKSCP